jgi:dethiobiotin synthetase
MSRFVVVTGTDTDVGKTVLTTLLTEHLLRRGRPVATIKPICSGGREDALALEALQTQSLSLEEINPWHFRAYLAPLMAARLEREKVSLAEVVAHVRRIAARFDLVLVEGAGGLLSPLGEDFDTRDLIRALRADVVVVAPDKLGAVSQTRLVLECLPPGTRRRASVVLMSQPSPDRAAESNAALLGEFFNPRRIHSLPWFHDERERASALETRAVQNVLKRLV